MLKLQRQPMYQKKNNDLQRRETQTFNNQENLCIKSQSILTT